MESLFAPRDAGEVVQDAAGLARDLFGLNAVAARLPGEYDANFHLTGAEGAGHVLKVMRPGCPRELVELQQEALEHLAVAAPDLLLPRVCRTRSGEGIASVMAPDGTPRLVWMLTWVPGRVLAESRPRSPELLQSLGSFLGSLDAALAGFAPPTATRELKWDLARAGWIREHLGRISGPARRALVEQVLDRFTAEVVPLLPELPRSTIHNDANDWNVVVRSPRAAAAEVASLVDFGDMVHTCTVFEVAVAAAYALLGEREPMAAAAHVVAGYHAAFPLSETEISLLFPLITTRLAVSVTNAACNRVLEPDDLYLMVSEAPAWEALERLAGVHPRFAHAVFRQACGLVPVPGAAAVVDWLASLEKEEIGPVLDADLRSAPCTVLDLSVGSLWLGADPAALDREALDGLIARELRAAGTGIGIGRYDEARLVYTEPAFGSGPRPTDERRTIHLGIDLFVPAGTPVYAPLDGTVEAFADHTARQDYGPVIALRHAAGDGQPFFTLWGHLSRESLDGLAVGRPVPRGARVGWIGAPPENGDWPPHLHLQVITDLFDRGTDVPGVARASERAVWLALAPDPNLLLRIPAARFPAPQPDWEETLERRRAATGGNVRLSYRRPLQIVRGWMQHLYDETGRAFLDVFNNVPLVGHSHPRVVRAVQAQMALLNTNTRYLHPNLVRYAERLTRRMPDPLQVCYLLNSASEANELALRLARTHTGRRDVIVLEHAYHGNTGGLIEISPYKLNGPGGGPPPPWVHVAPIPDDYRGPYKRSDPDAGVHYARHVADCIAAIGRRGPGEGPAAFIAETLPSVGGQVVLPPGYLKAVYALVRAAGGLCIADEVQVGFGRLGADFWGFGTQGVVPDIVVLGKPIGNGFPLAAVVTTPEVAASFDNGMEFFSTFGGNPVACAAGLAVLDVVEEEGLQEHARRLGDRLLAGLRDLQSRHALVGDVRGRGLFLGAELVRDRETLEPAGEEAGHVADRLRERGILAGTDGPHHNVLKIRPPLILQETDADFFLEVLDEVLGEDAVRVG